MDVGGTTWIVTADAEQARFFVERARSGDVHELPDLHMSATGSETGAGRGQRATVHQRVGAGRHGAGDHDPKHDAEHKFLRRVATQLSLASGKGEFESLVLMLPPRALGVLRSELPDSVIAKVEASDPHERCHDNPEDVRRHLREARAKA